MATTDPVAFSPDGNWHSILVHGPNSSTGGHYPDWPEISVSFKAEKVNTDQFKISASIDKGPFAGSDYDQSYSMEFRVGSTLDSTSTSNIRELFTKPAGESQWSDNQYSGSYTYTVTSSGNHTIHVWFMGMCTSRNCDAGHWREAANTEATFTLSVTATFKPNEGTWSDGTTSSKSVEVDYNTKPSAPMSLSRTGYTFDGWNPALAKITYDTTYTATWSINSSTLKVNPNGGSWKHADETYTSTVSFTQNYKTTLSVANPTGASVTITFKPNGGSWQSGTSTGDKTKSGNRVFNSWSKSSNFHGTFEDKVYTFGSSNNVTDTLTASYGNASVAAYTSTDIIQDGWILKGWTDGTTLYQPGATIQASASKTLTAVWKTSPIMKYDGTKWVPWVSPGSNIDNVDLVWTRNSSGSWERKGKIYKYNGTSWVQILGKEK